MKNREQNREQNREVFLFLVFPKKSLKFLYKHFFKY
jgi:hypothetical protein